MEGIKIYNLKDVEKIIKTRDGETKFGERVHFIEDLEELVTIDAKYVLFGVPEDIGVRGNLGKAGTSGAWKCCLNSLLNIQANQYTKPEKMILLGEVDCGEAMKKASNIDPADPNYHLKLGDLISKIDEVVSGIVAKIISAGKIPIIIGGGHNNAFGNIKGASEALKKPLNVLNIDAHTDLRRTDYRHSGNGFSCARKENFLGKYRIFGLHQNYTPEYIFNEMNQSANDGYRLFEHLILMPSEKIVKSFREEMEFVSHDNFGLELDCDAIKGFPSSAQTPSGFAINMIRNFIRIASEEEHIKYLHICEAAPTEETENKIGKALSYFITDFIR
ncbi:arginase family protein [Gillisia hiemivivida]|uniref:Formimidoylglutamase n=1 Tax=Gillisia hiemivivida TaxID=291190 RepID=A0A5C6ZU88_9FLAO|nr:arginase family protein [Gillisia hiemivivida]TXD94301.1 formimidoylglutamase [Gillisia hiemivivida]